LSASRLDAIADETLGAIRERGTYRRMRVLEGVHHPRIKYPEPAKEASAVVGVEPAGTPQNGEPDAVWSDGGEDVESAGTTGLEEIAEQTQGDLSMDASVR